MVDSILTDDKFPKKRFLKNPSNALKIYIYMLYLI